ncbi:MFS general substrate transporter [Aspergillus affinis]|uniref:MFS general substrate transporter n=1 Tax=Aspergillus affinis TaxID=1070780 RepID=UPI0022FEFE61|nr:MFS general substrate transporter [Aspergillus affinis]KAI9037637.1 MFS general substrate transporter [Aspergillus affinis]
MERGDLERCPSTGNAMQLESQPTPEAPVPSQDPQNDNRNDAQGAATPMAMQGLPPQFPSHFAEIVFIVLCTMGQLLFAICLANMFVVQITLVETLQISSLADLWDPKWLMVGSFVWLTIWNIVGSFSIHPGRAVLFFVVRAMIGIAIGVLCSTAMSLLGRIYRPGLRKNRVFSAMGAMIPLGFGIGALQGGAFNAHLQWIFGSTAILSAMCTIAALWCIPSLQKSRDPKQSETSFKDFDIYGSIVLVAGCGLLIFGLTQGVPSQWAPYSYATIIVGFLLLVAFSFVENHVRRPLIDNRLWTTKGFVPLMLSYFLGYGAFTGAWLLYAVRFLLTEQHKQPIIAACCLIPMTVSGVVASWVVSRTLHKVPGHYVLVGSMLAFACGPAFFLPQTPNTIYWAFSFPCLLIATFGPDMSFAAISVFITSRVPNTFQGAAGGLLIAAQSISSAVFAAVGDSIGEKVSSGEGYNLDLHAMRSIWWFSLACSIVGGMICAIFVRIPKEDEKEHLH